MSNVAFAGWSLSPSCFTGPLPAITQRSNGVRPTRTSDARAAIDKAQRL